MFTSSKLVTESIISKLEFSFKDNSIIGYAFPFTELLRLKYNFAVLFFSTHTPT